MKKLNENLSSEKLVYGLIIFFILFLGVVNYDLNKNISATDDIVSETIINGYKQSNNKYCSDTLKSLLGSNLLDINKNLNITYVSIPLIPEIENIKCLDKIGNLTLTQGTYNIEIYNNKKILTFTIYLFISLLLFLLLFTNKDKLKIYLYSSTIISYLIYDIFYSSVEFERLLSQLITNILIFFLLEKVLQSHKVNLNLTDPILMKKYLFYILLTLTLFSIIFIDYVFMDYFLYLCFFGVSIVFIITRIFSLEKLDAGLIILLSHFALVINSVDLPLSRNHLSYMPNILSSYSGILSSDFQANVTFPYPAFKTLTLFLINIFGLNIINFLNHLTYFLIIFFIVLFIYYLFPKSYILISISYIFLISRTFHKVIFSDYMGLENYNFLTIYSSNGLGDSSLLTGLYEPTGFDILIFPAIVLILKKKEFWGFLILSISVVMHTYNIVPALLILLTYLFLTKKIDTELLKVTSPLIITIVSFVYYYSTSYLSTPADILLADKILTDTIMVGHRNFNYIVSLFLYTPFNINLDISNVGRLLNLPIRESNVLGFHFHFEIIIFTVFLLYKTRNIFLKRFIIFTFLGIIFSLILSKANEYNYFGSLLRNVVPWKTSAIIYFLATIYLLAFIYKKFEKFNYSFIFVLLIFTQIYLQEISFNDYVTGPNNPTLNQEFLRRDLTELSKNNNQYTQKTNLTMRYDGGIIFKNFYPTTGNYFSHPYKPSEIIEWSNINTKILNFKNSNPTCKDAENLLKEFELSTILFSKSNFIPTSLKSCQQLVFDNNLEIYVFK